MRRRPRAWRWLAEPGALRTPRGDRRGGGASGAGSGSSRAAWTEPGSRSSGGAWRTPTAPARSRSGIRAPGCRPRSGRSRSRTSPRPTGRRSTPSAGCCRSRRWHGSAARCRPPPSRRSSGWRQRSLTSSGLPEPPARLHGDLWSGNVDGGRRRAAVADRPVGVRRASRGGPRDAAAVRRARASGCSPHTQERRRCRRDGRSASSSTSCCRCSFTPFCSAARTAEAAHSAARRYAG